MMDIYTLAQFDLPLPTVANMSHCCFSAVVILHTSLVLHWNNAAFPVNNLMCSRNELFKADCHIDVAAYGLGRFSMRAIDNGLRSRND